MTKNFFSRKKSWSVLKDKIIDYYLKPYIAKILATRRPLVIVDCFAGKGAFDDGFVGSPLIIAERIKSELLNNPGSLIKGFFIEKKYFKELKENLAGFSNCALLEGTYEENIEDIIKSKGLEGSNLFLYVDPYGIKSLDFSYFRKLSNKRLNSIELLMNFDSFGFLREGCRLLNFKKEFDSFDTEDEYEIDEKNTVPRMNAIACGSYWQNILKDYKNGNIKMFEAEERLMSGYTENVKKNFRYSVNIPIKEKTVNIPKYRLIFATNHPDGLFLMVNNMNQSWQLILEQEREGQQVLFEYVFPDMTQIKGFNLENDILDFTNNKILLKSLLIKLIEKYGISFSEKDYIRTLKEMEKVKKIEIIRNPEYTPKSRRKATTMDYSNKNYEISVIRGKSWQLNLL